MTNAQFKRWREAHFKSRLACADTLGLNRDTVEALETGTTRKGNAYPVPTHIALACAAWTLGLKKYDGGPVMIGG